MCIIIYQKNASIPVKAEWFRNSHKNNSDGYGMSYISDEGLTIFRTMDFNVFRKTYRAESDKYPKSPFLLHFRKNTTGKNSVENCHPFFVKGDIAMMHNGSISNIKVPLNSVESDTNLFSKEILDGLPDGWLYNKPILRMIDKFIGSSKLAIMDGDGKVSIINESIGHWYKGLWMSNYSYYPDTRSIQKTKPATWTTNTDLKNVKKDKLKTQIYKHPNGDFTRFMRGKLLKWVSKLYAWKEVTDKNKIVPLGMCLHSDSPSPQSHNIIDVTVNVEDRNNKKLVPVEEEHVCAWCQSNFPISKLMVYFLSYGVESDYNPYQVLCKQCGKDIEESYLGTPRPQHNVRHLIKNYKNELWVS